MKVVFMGTPDFAVASLRVLVESKKYEIVAVVSQPGLKERVAHKVENGKITLSGGTKSDNK